MGGDRVTDILSVLAEMRKERQRRGEYVPASELRLGAVSLVAERETERGRFKNLTSARNTISDALARRFGGRSLHQFDALADGWLRSESKALETAMLKACWNQEQETSVRTFFSRTRRLSSA